jgi:hypothetical protein
VTIAGLPKCDVKEGLMDIETIFIRRPRPTVSAILQPAFELSKNAKTRPQMQERYEYFNNGGWGSDP